MMELAGSIKDTGAYPSRNTTLKNTDNKKCMLETNTFTCTARAYIFY